MGAQRWLMISRNTPHECRLQLVEILWSYEVSWLKLRWIFNWHVCPALWKMSINCRDTIVRIHELWSIAVCVRVCVCGVLVIFFIKIVKKYHIGILQNHATRHAISHRKLLPPIYFGFVRIAQTSIMLFAKKDVHNTLQRSKIRETYTRAVHGQRLHVCNCISCVYCFIIER